MNLFDLPAYFNLIDRLEGVISTVINADWTGARRRRGATGVMAEAVSTITFHNAPLICVSRDSSWSGMDIERLLFRHGVKIWDRGLSAAGNDLCFRVKRRQVKWAEYLLLRAGVPVTSVLIEPRNLHYAEGYPPGSEPPSSWQPRRTR